MEKKFKLLPPLMPNFIRMEGPARKREEGFNPMPAIPVSDLSEEEAMEFAELMKEQFLLHWKLKRSQDKI